MSNDDRIRRTWQKARADVYKELVVGTVKTTVAVVLAVGITSAICGVLLWLADNNPSMLNILMGSLVVSVVVLVVGLAVTGGYKAIRQMYKSRVAQRFDQLWTQRQPEDEQ